MSNSLFGPVSVKAELVTTSIKDTESISSAAMLISSAVNANTLIGAAILFLGHPYILWVMLLQAHNNGLCYCKPIIYSS